MNDEYNDNDFVDPSMKEFVSKNGAWVTIGVIAFFLSWPIIIFLCMAF